MINFDINPVLFKIGVFEIRYYGIIYVLGFLIAFLYLNNKKEKLGLNKDDIYDLIFYLIIGIIIGSRLFEVLFWNPNYYFNNLLDIFKIWEGGLSFHGGLVGALISSYLFSKKKNIKILKLADALIIPTTIALASGRIGNLLNSEIYGTITNVSWCFNFANVEGCRHPYQIYSSLGHILTFLILLKLSKKNYKEGYLFFTGMFLFGLTRFVLDFLREDPTWVGLTLGHYFSLVLMIITGYFLLK